MLKLQYKINYWSILLLLLLVATACSKSNQQQDKAQTAVADESAAILEFFVQNGDYTNSPLAPAIVSAADVYNNRDKNIMVIDLRSIEQFDAGHIENAIHVDPANVYDYFNNTIDPPAFEQIVFVCAKGQVSSYITGIMRLLGYDNTYSLRFGISSWNKELAQSGWDKSVGSEMEGKLEFTEVPKHEKTHLPKIETGGSSGLEIAKLRAQELLKMDQAAFLIGYQDILNNPGKYYTISYFTEEEYKNLGHLAGVPQYTPRESLSEQTDLLTLPTDQPVAVYCNTGQQSATVVAYLRMLGYDAYSVKFGANSFMYDSMRKNAKLAGHYWSEIHQNNLPLVSGSQTAAPDAGATEIKSVQGGC